MAHRTAPDHTSTSWPRSFPFIIANEGCERFSFYGMRGILKTYLTLMYVMQGMPEGLAANKGTAMYHFFNFGVYATPIVGAVLADRFFNKYRTILWVSLIYCAGHACLALFEGNLAGIYLGLVLISVGAGGIKPCVSAHMGDQFGRANRTKVERAFQAFYFIINFGSLFATIIIPWIMDSEVLKARGLNWSVAFGVPGVLMGIATLFFWLGNKNYVVVPANPGGKLGMLDVLSSVLLLMPWVVLILPIEADGIAPGTILAFKLVGLAASTLLGLVLFQVRQNQQADDGFLAVMIYSLRAKLLKHELPPLPSASNGMNAVGADMAGNLRHHWFFGPAAKRFGQEAAEGPMAVLKVVTVFLMVSVFWALFDQHSSSWIDQAEMMDREIWGMTVLPQQVGALNPALVMLLIPLVSFVIYPGITKLGFEMRPLRRMTVGMFIAATAFVSAALIQKQLDAGVHLHIGWQMVSYILITVAEVMISVTGLELAYTQAPRRMKSTITSFWQLTVALGNALAGILFSSMNLGLESFFWLFAGLMTVAALLFALRAAFYTYKEFPQQ